MSLSLHLKTKQKPKHRQKALFFVIIPVLLVSAFFLVKYLITPKFIKNFPINYYFELNLTQYNDVLPLWLENNSNHQELLNLWQGFYQKYLPKPPQNLFINKISLINVSYTPSLTNEGEQTFARLQDEIIILAPISSPQKLQNYLKDLGQIKKTPDEKINTLTPPTALVNYDIFYYTIAQKNQFLLSTDSELLKLALKNRINLNFPQENIFSQFSQTPSNEFLKIFSNPQKLPVLTSFVEPQATPLWLSFKLEPQKIILDFKNNASASQKLTESWLNFVSSSQDIAIFSQNLNQILDNPTLFPDKNTWQKLYNFEIEKDLYPMLQANQAGLLLIPKNPRYTLNWSDYHSILIISNKNWTSNSKEIKKIEQIAQNVFAENFLSEEKITLPDKSSITEFVARPENFKFQEKNLANISIFYLQKPGLEFAYVFTSDKIVFSTSISHLEQFLTSSKNPRPPDLGSLLNCLAQGTIPSDFIYFSPNAEFQAKYGLNQLILTNEKGCIY